MTLNRDDVEKIAYLARLKINDSAVEDYARNLSAIIGFVEQLNEADTASVEPMAHPLHAAQRLRQDVVTEKDQRELFQSLAPQAEEGLYLVPKVIE